MQESERELVVEHLVSSEVRLLALLDGLTAGQWSFREAPERWSIAENVEHLIAFEGFILRKVVEALDGPEEPEKRAGAVVKERLVAGLAEARSVRFVCREAVRPVGRWESGGVMVEKMREVRARTVAFVADTGADLRGHFFAHIAFGDLDCCQWLLLLASHMDRHGRQIEQIMADPAWPAS